MCEELCIQWCTDSYMGGSCVSGSGGAGAGMAKIVTKLMFQKEKLFFYNIISLLVFVYCCFYATAHIVYDTLP